MLWRSPLLTLRCPPWPGRAAGCCRYNLLGGSYDNRWEQMYELVAEMLYEEVGSYKI